MSHPHNITPHPPHPLPPKHLLYLSSSISRNTTNIRPNCHTNIYYLYTQYRIYYIASPVDLPKFRSHNILNFFRKHFSRNDSGPTQFDGDPFDTPGRSVPCGGGNPDDVDNGEFRWPDAGIRL